MLVEHVEKPHNLSATCAVVMRSGCWKRTPSASVDARTFNSTAQEAGVLVPLHDHADISTAISHLKQRGWLFEPT